MAENTNGDDVRPRNLRAPLWRCREDQSPPIQRPFAFRGKILDLSLGGCCVDSPVPIECGARH